MNSDSEFARVNFLERYDARTTRELYSYDLKVWYEYCETRGLDPLRVRRPHVEAFGRWLQEDRGNSPRSAARRLQTLRSFFKLSYADELIEHDPTVMIKMPRWHVDASTIATLSPTQVSRLLEAARDTSVMHHLMVSMLVILGLRVSELCSVQIEDIEEDALGYSILKVTRKGGKMVRMPIPVPLLRVVRAAIGDRATGTLLLTKHGQPQNRRGCYDWFMRLLKKAGLPEEAHPHTLRHAAITALVQSGMPMHEVQEFAGHADIRTTAHYYRRPQTLDQHGAHHTARIFSS